MAYLPPAPINPAHFPPDSPLMTPEQIRRYNLTAPTSPGMFPRLLSPHRRVFSPSALRSCRIRAGMSKRAAGIAYGYSAPGAGNWGKYEDGEIKSPGQAVIGRLAAAVNATMEEIYLPADVVAETPESPEAMAYKRGRTEGVSTGRRITATEMRPRWIAEGHRAGYHDGQLAGAREIYPQAWMDGYDAHARGAPYEPPPMPEPAAALPIPEYSQPLTTPTPEVMP